MAIRFSTKEKSLLDRPKLHPQYLRPDWLQKLKPIVEGTKGGKSAATCPSIVSTFKHCIVMPLWCDIRLTRGHRYETSELNEIDFVPHVDGRYSVPTFTSSFPVSAHESKQVGDDFPGVYGMEILPKPICPWLLEMDEGWSIYVTPATMHNRKPLPWEPIPGFINCDNWHQISMPCRYTREPELESTIFAGTPFAYFFPFKRTESPGEIDLRLIEGDEWKEIHSEPDACPYNKHLM